MHATVAPRRHQVQASPILECYEFVPYNEDDIAHNDPLLPIYIQVMESYVRQQLESAVLDYEIANGIKNRELIARFLKESSVANRKKINDNDLKPFLKHSTFHMINVLIKMFDIQHDKFYLENMKNLIQLERGNMLSDAVYSFIQNSHCLKTCLDIVTENCSKENGKLRVIECNAEDGLVFKNAISHLSMQPGLHLDYKVVCSESDVLDPELLENFGLEPVVWKISSGSPPSSQLIGADLVVLGNVLHKQNSIQETLSSVANLINDDGFLLVIEPTINLIVPLCFVALAKDLSYISDLEERSFGPFCTKEKWQEHLSLSGFKIVAQKSDGLLHTMFLCRKKSSAEVSLSNQTTIDVDDHSYVWVEDIKEALNAQEESTATGHSVWLKAKECHSGIVGFANCLSREPGGSKIRFDINIYSVS